MIYSVKSNGIGDISKMVMTLLLLLLQFQFSVFFNEDIFVEVFVGFVLLSGEEIPEEKQNARYNDISLVEWIVVLFRFEVVGSAPFNSLGIFQWFIEGFFH